MNIKSGDISPSATPDVFMLHFNHFIRLCRIGGMTAAARLDACFFIGRQDVLIILKRMPVPYSFIEIQDSPGFLGKLRITRKYPGTITPRTDGILVKPSPYGAVAYCGCKSRSSNFPSQIGNTPPRKGRLMDRGQFTGKRLNLHDNLRGEKSGGVRDGGVPPVPGDVLQKNVFATC
jgi:hypothetical protein